MSQDKQSRDERNSAQTEDQSLDSTVRILAEAAKKGNVKAAFQLGMMYANGDGVPLQYTKAFDLIEQAAEADLAEAQSTLAWLYSNGYGADQDDEKVRYWYHRAADHGAAKDLFVVATIYRFGQFGAMRDPQKSIDWYTRAADQGYTPAQFALGKMLMDGKSVEKDVVRAFQWLSVARFNGSKRADAALESLMKEMTHEQFLRAQAEMLALAGERGLH